MVARYKFEWYTELACANHAKSTGGGAGDDCDTQFDDCTTTKAGETTGTHTLQRPCHTYHTAPHCSARTTTL